MACSSSILQPKPPAIRISSGSPPPYSASSVSIPARIAALPICTCLTSSCRNRNLPSATGIPSVNQGSSNVPFSSMSPSRTASPTASIIPVPHKPIGVSPAMVLSSTVLIPPVAAGSLSRTRFVTAPGTPATPQDIFPPSKTGPAAAEVTRNPSAPPAAISPLVPMSSSNTFFSRSISMA